ncbi:unnamed protein product [Cuscuta campestris]|uniref:GCF C-terminal domain-containing protein n=1 Tax=Cuscuta campestris TaxID=132261 RepID=A0A484KVC6_9ASTE|nr:unnamed protein product [Cuscuta campestris]
MSGKARNFRRRGGDDVDEGETPAVSAPNGNSTKPLAKPVAGSGNHKKSLTLAPKSLLSFADDEDSEDSPFVRTSRPSSSGTMLAKASSSHKLSSGKGKSSTAASLTSNVQPQAGTYTKEALLELQKNTKTLASSRPTQLKSKPESVEPVIVLKGLVKPPITIGTELEKKHDSNSEKDDEMIERQGVSLGQDRENTLNRLGSMELDKGLRSTDDIGSEIPDQAMIDAIRAKRERLRQARAAAPDYISLDRGSNHGEEDGLTDEEPEFQGRIGFFGKNVDKGKRGVFEDFEASGSHKDGVVECVYDEEEEDKMWEEEQVRKGLGKRVDDGSSRGVSSSDGGVGNNPVASSILQTKFGYPVGGASVYSSVPTVVPVISPSSAGGSDTLSVSQQAELSKKSLLANVSRLKESHGRTLKSLSKTEENLSSSLSNLTALENSFSAASEKYIFMQDLRDFVSVMCSFLQEKAPYIEELEDQMQKLHKTRAEAILDRRAADNEDEMRELENAISAAKQVFCERGCSAATIALAKEAAGKAAAEARRQRDIPVKLDEFGRDLNQQKRMDMRRREKDRECRRAKSDAKRMSSIENDSSYQRVEGESSTDESDSESTAYKSNRDQLLQVAEEIFGDTNDEYSQLAMVVSKFERWKKQYSSSYRDAYMSLSLPAILSPYVRLELLRWDPLHEDADFSDMKWHSLLYNYGLPNGDGDISSDDADADSNLIPQLVEKLAIPIIHYHLEYCWDILSTRETKYAVSSMKLVFGYVPFSSSALCNLVAVLRNRLADAVANLVVPKWDNLVMKAVPNAARIAAYGFGTSVRLMRNICLWNNVLAIPILEKLALDELLSGKVLPHLWNLQSDIDDAITRTERIVASLYGVWAGPNVIGGNSPKLQPLLDYLLRLSKALEKKHLATGAEVETGKLARRLKKMLVELNEYDHAREISKTFSIKEAL